MSPPNSYVEASPLTWLLGKWVLKEATKMKWGRKGGNLIWQDWCPYKQRKRLQRSPSPRGHREKATRGPSEKGLLWPGVFLDLRLPASRTLIKCISVVLATRSGVLLLQPEAGYSTPQTSQRFSLLEEKWNIVGLSSHIWEWRWLTVALVLRDVMVPDWVAGKGMFSGTVWTHGLHSLQFWSGIFHSIFCNLFIYVPDPHGPSLPHCEHRYNSPTIMNWNCTSQGRW